MNARVGATGTVDLIFAYPTVTLAGPPFASWLPGWRPPTSAAASSGTSHHVATLLLMMCLPDGPHPR